MFLSADTHDPHWMRYALQLAGQVTERQVSPNPRVGCVLLDSAGRLVGQGWHAKAGTPHAEVCALNNLSPGVSAHTAYVTLEPCSHYGRTPPCALALIQAGLKRVVYAHEDPNAQVAGQGLQRLRDAGIQVDGPCLAEEAARLNPVFMHHIVHRTPYIAVKIATSLDGHMVDAYGQSQWLTGPDARQHVHAQRLRFDAILSTAATVLADNSRLTVRLPHVTGPAPVRVVLDRQGQLAAHAHLALWQPGDKVWIVTAAPETYAAAAPALPVQLLPWPVDTHDPLSEINRALYAQGIASLWVEAGPRLSSALLASNQVQQLWWYRAGKLLGGGQSAVVWPQALPLAQAQMWTPVQTAVFPPDSLTVWEK